MRGGHTKGLKWWARLRGDERLNDLGSTCVVDGDTAYYAWNEGARLLGVDPHHVEVERIIEEVENRGPDPNHDPWYWLKSETKDELKRSQKAGSRAPKKRKAKGKSKLSREKELQTKRTKRTARKCRAKASGRDPKGDR